MTGEHEFVAVGGRRWCLCCDLFQVAGRNGWPLTQRQCPRTTPYAQQPATQPPPAGR